MTSASWHPLAKRELFEASSFYEAEAPGLGDIFLAGVQQGVGLLKEQPRLGREVVRGIRRLVILRFPYSVFYRLEGGTSSTPRRIFILALSHHKRRPRYWAARS